MVNKTLRIITKIVCIILIVQLVYMPISHASFLGDIFKQGDDFVEEGKEGSGDVIDETELQTSVKGVYNVLFAIGVGTALIVGAILGIQFMVGSIEAKTKAKEALIPYVIGCIVVFGAFGIWKVTMNIMNEIETASIITNNTNYIIAKK